MFSVHLSLRLPLSHIHRDTHGHKPKETRGDVGCVYYFDHSDGVLGGAMVMDPAANVGDPGDAVLSPGLGRSPSPSRKWQPTPVFLPRKSRGQRSLAGYSPWGCEVRHD